MQVKPRRMDLHSVNVSPVTAALAAQQFSSATAAQRPTPAEPHGQALLATPATEAPASQTNVSSALLAV